MKSRVPGPVFFIGCMVVGVLAMFLPVHGWHGVALSAAMGFVWGTAYRHFTDRIYSREKGHGR